MEEWDQKTSTSHKLLAKFVPWISLVKQPLLMKEQNQTKPNC